MDVKVYALLKRLVEDLAGVGRTTETVKSNADALSAHRAALTLDHPDNSVTDDKLGPRTIDQSLADPSDTGTLTHLLS